MAITHLSASSLDQLEVNIGSGNDLVPTGTKPVPDPMLTQNWPKICNFFYAAICYKQAFIILRTVVMCKWIENWMTCKLKYI